MSAVRRRRVHLVLPSAGGGFRSVCGQFSIPVLNWREVPNLPTCGNCERIRIAQGSGAVRMLEIPRGVGVSVYIGGWTFTGSGGSW